MWYEAEATSAPRSIDDTSSKKYIYVTRNVTTEERVDDNGTKYTVWVYEEAKIDRDFYPIYERQISDEARIADIEEVITEILGGGII